ncbi:FecR family protein [Gaoshiqia sp. Z1-71]|uniref:FecR family protein n=1 Tax=Gaoshiqia hydrogeniformans TaxID=3290090 RepID=UPI003BF8A0C2
MQKKKEIKELLERFSFGKISKAERKIVFDFFNDPENEPLVYDWIGEKWNETGADELTAEFSSADLLNRIHRKIEQQKQSGVSVLKKGNARLSRIAKVALRYAAVCLLAWGAQWYWLTQLSESAGSQSSYNEIVVPHGSKSMIVLGDSTKVWLNAGARFRYPTNFEQKGREIFLEGEAYFEVQKDEHRPFLVNMNGMNIKVHGTKFNVRAYAGDTRIETALLEGSIEVIGVKSAQGNDDNLFLKPGQKLVLFKEINQDDAISDHQGNRFGDSAPVKIARAELTNLLSAENEIAWCADKLVFERQRFDEVKTKLERWYGVTIDIQDSSVLNYRFTGTFDQETFEQAIGALKHAASFEYELNKKHVIIRKNK